MIYPHSYGWKHYSSITSASPSLVVFPPSKPQGIFAPYSQSFKHLSTAGLHSSISLALTVLAGYISALPGKKVQCFVSILSLERILLYLRLFLFSLCLPCVHLFITSGLCYSGGQLIPLVPAGLTIHESCMLSASQLLILLSFVCSLSHILLDWY